MPLSLDTIYKPLNDFFLNHFKTSSDSPVFFRFDKFGSAISEKDFIDPGHPELGNSPALAREKFSDLVNNVPIEDADGVNIFLSPLSNIDELYHDQLLLPSFPFIPQGSDQTIQESIRNSFNNIKAAAIKDYDNIRLESSTGLMFDFKPAIATPQNWYDKSNDEVWTSQSFSIQESTTVATDKTAKTQLWKLRLDDAKLQEVLPALKAEKQVKPADLTTHVFMMKSVAATRFAAPAGGAVGRTVTPMVAGAHRMSPAAEMVAIKSDDAIVRSPVKQNFHNAFWGLDLKNRLLVRSYIKENAPTQPVTTSSFKINFKYCVVNIDRPWYKDSFINNKSWFIPNTTKGQLTSKSITATNIPLLPIGFVAIKNLDIEANWANVDIENSKTATDFGPFSVSSEIVNNKLSHEGIQIIGWLLQRMPDLPPNDPQ